MVVLWVRKDIQCFCAKSSAIGFQESCFSDILHKHYWYLILEHKFKSQEMTLEEVALLKQKEAEIISRTKTKTDAITKFDEAIWEEEIQQNHLIQEVETSCTTKSN